MSAATGECATLCPRRGGDDRRTQLNLQLEARTSGASRRPRSATCSAWTRDARRRTGRRCGRAAATEAAVTRSRSMRRSDGRRERGDRAEQRAPYHLDTIAAAGRRCSTTSAVDLRRRSGDASWAVPPARGDSGRERALGRPRSRSSRRDDDVHVAPGGLRGHGLGVGLAGLGPLRGVRDGRRLECGDVSGGIGRYDDFSIRRTCPTAWPERTGRSAAGDRAD